MTAATKRALTLLALGYFAVGYFAQVAVAQDTATDGSAAEAAPPPELVLQPPADVEVACGYDTFAHFTAHWRSCATRFYEGEDPDEDCCQGLVAYYGSNALPLAGDYTAANCFCDADVFGKFATAEETTYFSMKTALLVCARMGYIVPFFDEDDDGNPTGYCYGVPPDQETLDSASVDDHSAGDVPSIHDYARRLKQDGLVMLAFITGPLSGVGVLLLLWPLVWEAVVSMRSCLLKRD